MGRANTRTLLPLDRFFQIIGIDPLHANQLTSALRPAGTCSDVLYQWNWQQPAQAGREEIAQAIRDAELAIRDWVGFNVLPDWTVDEQRMVTRLVRRESYATGYNVRGAQKSVNTRWGHFMAGGQRVKTLIAHNAAIAWSDPDGDGYKEIGTVVSATTVTDASEVHAYLPAHAGDDAWEIRPLRSVAFGGGNVTVQMDRHQLVDETLWEALDAGAAGPIDADTDANFVTEVDLYRVYHDPQTQVQFIWEPDNCTNCGGSGCAQCTYATQYGCLTARDTRLGMIMYSPATWNADTLEFDAAEWAGCREPDRLRLWYRSGWQDMDRAYPTLQMDPYWERTVAMLALAQLQGDLCDCSAAKTFVNWAREDYGIVDGVRNVSFVVTRRAEQCPWGMRRGAVEAFARCNADGRRNAI